MRLYLWHERGSLCLQLWVLWFFSPQEKQYLTLDRVWALSCLTYGVGLGPRNTFSWYLCPAAPRPAPGPVAPAVLRWVTEPAAPRGAEGPDAGAGFLGCGLHGGPTGLRMSSLPVALCDRDKFLINLRDPAADKYSPSRRRKPSITSPFFATKLSAWSMKIQPFDSEISLTFELISDPLDAAKEPSVLGQMPLMTIWPVTNFSFATSMICDRFSVIFSVGNLVAVSLVPTWMIISEWADDFVFSTLIKYPQSLHHLLNWHVSNYRQLTPHLLS